MKERQTEPTPSWGRGLVTWLLVAVGAVLLVRLIVRVLELLGVAVTWLQGAMAQAWGWIGPVDLVIAGVVLVVGLLSLLRRQRNANRTIRRHDRS